MSVTLPTYPLQRRTSRLPEVVVDGLPAGHALRGSVLVLGNFDGFHLGHQALARMANELAAGAPVAVMSCEPHPRNFFSQDQTPFRLATPAAKQLELGQYGVDFVYSPRFDQSFAKLEPVDFVDGILAEALGVRHVIAGPDFRFGHKRSGDMGLLAQLGSDRGFRVSVAPDVTHAGVRISSTLIRSAIEAGDVSGAVRLMGHGWLVETQSTADGGLMLHPLLCRPRPGRYVGRADGGGEALRIEIGADGAFRPLGPHRLPDPRQMWRLEGQCGRRRHERPFAAL